jgi:hypothetical protein
VDNVDRALNAVPWYGVFAWLGTVVVGENAASSIVHTHLFGFSNGWLYGIGVLAGSVLHVQTQAARQKSEIDVECLLCEQ